MSVRISAARFLLLALPLIGCGSCGNNRETISLDGIWEAAVATDGNADRIPDLFDHVIPVPGHWPLMTPEEKYRTEGALWYRTTYKAPKRLPPRVVLRIAKAEFGRTVFVNGVKADFYPFNFSSSETDIRPYLEPGSDNEIVVRVKCVEDILTDGSPTAHNGSDYERLHYYPGIYDSVTIIESGWPAVTDIETKSDLDRGVVTVRATLFNGGDNPVCGDVSFSVGRDVVRVKGQPLVTGESRQVISEVQIRGFDKERDSWTPESPKLYSVSVRTEGDEFTRRFGMRTFKVDPERKRFILNGEERFLTGTNTDLFRFFDDPQCGDKPWDKEWVRELFCQFKEVGWDSFRNCISAAPDFWYDLCDEMGLMVQDEYPFWTCGSRHRDHACLCDGETLLPEYKDWLRDRGTHPSIVIIDLQNESFQDWFRDLAAALKPLDFQERPFEMGWTSPNPDKGDAREYHPYFFLKGDFTLGYLNAYDGTVTDGSLSFYPGGQEDGLTKIINEYGWDWINRNGDATILGKPNYAFNLPSDATREDRRDFYAWSVGVLTEYWRTRSEIAGIHHFTSLTYSFEEAEKAWTGDILSPDLTRPVIRTEVMERFRSSFAPVAVVVDDYMEDVIAGREKELSIVLLNESRDNRPVSRDITATLTDSDGDILYESHFALEAEPHGRDSKRIVVGVPEAASGNLVFTVSTPEGTKSERRWKVLNRAPGYALGAPVSASSEVPDFHGGRPAICVTDGSPLTRWVNVIGDSSPWIIVDLGAERSVSECDVAWYTDAGNILSPAMVRISVSTDRKTYRKVAEAPAPRVVPPDDVSARPDHSLWQTLSFPSVKARYVRLESVGPLPVGEMSISELEVR